MRKRKTLLLTLITMMTLTGGLVSCQKITRSSSAPSGVISDDEEFVVKFNNNYDGTVTRVVVKAGELVTLPPDPVRPGYTFVGWFLSYREDTNDVFDASAPITKDLTVFAKWAQDNSVHIVTFHYQDKVTPDQTMTVDHGETIPSLATPVYPDGTMIFTGWFTDSQCTKPFDPSSPINDNLDLYAGWRIAKATITFHYNYTGSPEAKKVVVDIDQPMSAPEDPSREHFAFLGWFDRAVGGNLFDFSAPITGDLTLYAHWQESEFLVSFDANGGTYEEGTQSSAYIAKGASALAMAENLQAKLSYVGHDFKGWYLEKLDPNSETDATIGKEKADLSSIGEAFTFYAGWALHEYKVSFSLAYENAENTPADQAVKYGKTAQSPANPEREGYLFGGWFLDAGYQAQFTFDMPVTADLTLYAKWIEEGVAHDPVKVSYYIGSELYQEKTVEFNAAASSNAPADPTKTNAIFGGWYRDQAFTVKFNMNANLDADVTVYGKFLDRYTFEAEAVDFTGKVGFGTSTNSNEEQMIYDGAYIRGGRSTVSNSFFVRELYYNGATLDFVIESTKAVTDAVLYLRVSSESYRFATTKMKNEVEYNYLSSSEFKICVNADFDENYQPSSWLDYPGLYMPMANLAEKEDLSPNKTPFEDCLITTTLSLDEGVNIITLMVDNFNDHGGTFHAEAPMIDCMYIYSDAQLSMDDYEFYKKPGVNMLE